MAGPIFIKLVECSNGWVVRVKLSAGLGLTHKFFRKGDCIILGPWRDPIWIRKPLKVLALYVARMVDDVFKMRVHKSVSVQPMTKNNSSWSTPGFKNAHGAPLSRIYPGGSHRVYKRGAMRLHVIPSLPK